MKRVALLELCEVSYCANGRKILDGLSWKVLKGEHWALLGPNGSGKTTVLKIACGYLWPNGGGTVYRKGRRLIDLRELRKSIGWVTSTLASQVPAREKALRTVVSGKFAQVGLLEGFGANPSLRDYDRAEKYLTQLGASHLSAQEYGALSRRAAKSSHRARAHDQSLHGFFG